MRKVFLGLCVTFMLIAVAMGLGTLVPRPFAFPAGFAEAKPATTDNVTVLVLSNPIHTDIALPATPEVLDALSFVSEGGLELDFPGVEWIIVGWGSRAFYIETPTWGDLKPGPVISALTWDSSVMHVQRAGAIPLNQDFVRTANLEQEKFQLLLAAVQSSFQTSETIAPKAIEGATYGPHDIFFPAKGGFNALMGCNTWTARMLRIAGLRTGMWTPLPVTLRWSLDLHNTL